MKTLTEFFQKNDIQITEVIKTDCIGRDALSNLMCAISNYFDRYYLSSLNISFEINEEIIELYLRSEGYEQPVYLFNEDERICEVTDVLNAIREIEKLIIEIYEKK